MSELAEPRAKPSKLPPISKKDGDDESPGPSEPRPRRKKRVQSPNGEVRPRSTSRTRRASGSGAQAAEESEERRPRPKAKKKSSSPTRAEVTDDGETPRKKKTTKKKPTSSSREQLMSDPDADNPMSDRSTKSATKKKRRKKKPTNALSETEEEPEPEIGLEAELRELQDDVISPDAATQDDALEAHWNTPAMRSEPVNKIFIEQRNGFKTADKAKIARRRADAEQQRMVVPVTTSAQTTIQFALGSHKIFKALSLFIQGLFSGLTLWQIVQTWTLSDLSPQAFLENYYFLAWPVQSLYYFLFIISTVSAFDRYDISRPTKECSLKAITLQSGAVSCFFYFVGLVFSVSMASTDQKISMYQIQPSLWQDPDVAQSEINTWRILNMVRGLMAMIGWLIVSLRPRTDRLTENLERGQENMLGDEPDNIMLDPTVRSSGV